MRRKPYDKAVPKPCVASLFRRHRSSFESTRFCLVTYFRSLFSTAKRVNPNGRVLRSSFVILFYDIFSGYGRNKPFTNYENHIMIKRSRSPTWYVIIFARLIFVQTKRTPPVSKSLGIHRYNDATSSAVVDVHTRLDECPTSRVLFGRVCAASAPLKETLGGCPSPKIRNDVIGSPVYGVILKCHFLFDND